MMWVVVQLLSRVCLFVTPWTAACQASRSIANSRSLLKLISIESVMPSNHLILCRPLLLPGQSFPESRSFPMGWFFTSGGQSTGVSASVSILPMNIQGWFPSGLTGLISLQTQWIWIWVGDGQGRLVCCSPWGHKESDMTEQLNWTEQVWGDISLWFWLSFSWLLVILNTIHVFVDHLYVVFVFFFIDGLTLC